MSRADGQRCPTDTCPTQTENPQRQPALCGFSARGPVSAPAAGALCPPLGL